MLIKWLLGHYGWIIRGALNMYGDEVGKSLRDPAVLGEEHKMYFIESIQIEYMIRKLG
jgi:hypothetical protein